MSWRLPSDVGGYVLAGGRSSRMGQDKAMLELAGKPLILHAVLKLRRVCMDVSIVSNNEALDAYAPLVRDVHPDCGPMSGMEAALLHSKYEWNLISPVDLPFLPTAFLDHWVRRRGHLESLGASVAIYTVKEVPQPTLALVRKAVQPYLTRALEAGNYKLFPVLKAAGEALAEAQGLRAGFGCFNLPWNADSSFAVTAGFDAGESCWATTPAQARDQELWFANVNTPEEFAAAEEHADALDT